jgi:hypothetical protein
MLGKRKIVSTVDKNINHFRFHKDDLVLCVKSNIIKKGIVISRYNVSGINYYKITNEEKNLFIVSKESELIFR